MASVISDILEATLPGVTRGVGLALPYLHSLTLQGTPLGGGILKHKALIGPPPSLPRLSANEVIRQLRTLGFHVRRQNALKAISAIRQQAESMSYVNALPNGRRPLMNGIPFSSHNIRLKYQVTVSLTGHDATTGELRQQFIRINSPSLITKNQAMADAAELVLGRAKYEFGDVVDASVTLYVRQNPGINR